MRICSIEGCGRKHMGKGYCTKHYGNFYRTGNPLGKYNGNKEALYKYIRERNTKFFGCKVEGCNLKHYSKGYCRNHAANFLRCGNPIGSRHKCLVDGCNNNVLKDYCTFHKSRVKNGVPLDLPKFCNKGERNYKWKGGIATYPNHYLMKQNRLLVLERAKGLCEICGNKGKHIHHKDGSKTNHNTDNLILLCLKCHGLIHKGRKNKTSKFIRLYGNTIPELANRLKVNNGMIYSLHIRNKLKEFLTTQQKDI